jgi:hypothetical protein
MFAFIFEDTLPAAAKEVTAEPEIDLDVFVGGAREVVLDESAGSRAVNIRGRTPAGTANHPWARRKCYVGALHFLYIIEIDQAAFCAGLRAPAIASSTRSLVPGARRVPRAFGRAPERRASAGYENFVFARFAAHFCFSLMP